MAVPPVPAHGCVVVDGDRPARALRISAHPELSRVVLSIWDGQRCIGTVRLAPQDVPDVVRTLTDASVPDASVTDAGPCARAVPPAS